MTTNRRGTQPNRPAGEPGFPTLRTQRGCKGNCRVRLKGEARTVEMWMQPRAAATIYALKEWYGKRLPERGE